MKPVNSKYIPEKGMEKAEMKDMQREIAEKAVFQDHYRFLDKELVVAGIDQAFTDEKCVTAVTVMKNGEIIEVKHGAVELEIPYIPGLLAFREGKSIVETLEKIESNVDLLMLDGSGRVHFRQAGIATHIGVVFEKPSIGVAKNLLCGETSWKGEKLSQGARKQIRSDKNIENAEDEILGYLYQSKQYKGDRKVNPLYVSAGHKISSETAVKIVEKHLEGYKLPEPVRIADEKVSEFKQDYS